MRCEICGMDVAAGEACPNCGAAERRTYRIRLTWTVTQVVEVEAASPGEAVEIAVTSDAAGSGFGEACDDGRVEGPSAYILPPPLEGAR